MTLRIPTPTRDGSSRQVCSECSCLWTLDDKGEPNFMQDWCNYLAPARCLCHSPEWVAVTYEEQPLGDLELQYLHGYL